MKLGVQLYSLRNDFEGGEGLLNILPKLKELGFDGVEFAGTFGLTAEALKAKLDETGLEVAGAHAGLGAMKPENIEETIAFYKALGAKTIGTGGGATGTPEELAQTCAILKAANERGAKDGIKFYFHNHSREFTAISDGKVPMNELMNAGYVQVDTYWSFHAGVDNYEFLTENRDRIVHIHIKDGVDGKPCALGEGQCDLAAVIKAAKEIGFEWVILENDDPVPTGLEDIARSMKFLKANV